MDTGDPQVSVVVPVYNGERYVRGAVESVLAQRGFDSLEVVAVDDGSRDESHEILASLDDPRVRLFRHENRGIAVTRNAAIGHSRGRFVAFLDQDDLWHPDKLAAQMPEFERDPRVGLVHCQAVRIDAEGNRIHSGPVVVPSRMRGDVREGMLVRNLVPGTAGVVVRRECFDELGLFDESLSGSDDWEMWSRIAGRYEFGFVNRGLCSLRLHAENTSLDVERMRRESTTVQKMLFANPDMVRGLSARRLEKLRRLSTARIHLYCASWLLRGGRRREARADLWRAVRLHPTRPRHLVLFFFTLLGWLPGPVRKRLV